MVITIFTDNIHVTEPKVRFSYKLRRVFMYEKCNHSKCCILIRLWEQLSLCCVAALKCLPVLCYSIVIFAFSGPKFGTVGFNTFIWEQSCAQSRVSGVRNGTSANISHEQTQSNQVCCFQMLDAVFPMDLFSDCLQIYLDAVFPMDLFSDYLQIYLRWKYFKQKSR